MFDIPNIERTAKNTCIVLVATYVTNIWIARKLELTPSAAIRLIKGKIIYNKSINSHRLRNRFHLFLSEAYKELEHGTM